MLEKGSRAAFFELSGALRGGCAVLLSREDHGPHQCPQAHLWWTVGVVIHGDVYSPGLDAFGDNVASSAAISADASCAPALLSDGASAVGVCAFVVGVCASSRSSQVSS